MFKLMKEKHTVIKPLVHQVMLTSSLLDFSHFMCLPCSADCFGCLPLTVVSMETLAT